MSIIEGMSDESIRIIADIDTGIENAHNEFSEERKARGVEDEVSFLPELTLAIVSQVEPAAEAWIATGGCCDDRSVEHNLKSFGVIFGRVMYLAGRAGVEIPIGTDDWQPSFSGKISDEDFTAWKMGFEANSEARSMTEEKQQELIEQIGAVLEQFGLTPDAIKVMPMSALTGGEGNSSDESNPGFGQYL